MHARLLSSSPSGSCIRPNSRVVAVMRRLGRADLYHGGNGSDFSRRRVPMAARCAAAHVVCPRGLKIEAATTLPSASPTTVLRQPVRSLR